MEGLKERRKIMGMNQNVNTGVEKINIQKKIKMDEGC